MYRLGGGLGGRLGGVLVFMLLALCDFFSGQLRLLSLDPGKCFVTAVI